jgi:hypothetical protein
VRGALINETGVEVAVDTTLWFRDITIENADSLTFSQKRDVIGHEWKYYNNEDYVIDTLYNFIIKDKQGFYYKLKFVGYHNEMNQPGYPVFEYQAL